MVSSAISIYFVLSSLISCVLSNPGPGYGSYNYDGYGHHGYNEIGTVKKVVDYYSKPQYAFGYEVEDYYNALSHGRWEIRDGDVTQGQYRVLLPDGRIQIVSYIADKFGYRPTIQYIGKGEHPPPPPLYAHVKKPKAFLLEKPAGEVVVPFPVEKEIPLGPGPAPIPPPGHFGPTPQPHYNIEPALVSGPFKLDVNPLALNPYPGPYARGFGRGNLLYGGSSIKEVKVSPKKLSRNRKRALLYNRTLFRRDIPTPSTTPRK